MEEETNKEDKEETPENQKTEEQLVQEPEKPTAESLVKETDPLTFKNWHDKYYKILLLIPAILLFLSLAQLVYTYQQTGDFIIKDITLTGGTSITVFTEQEINIKDLKSQLSEQLDDFNIRELSDFRTGRQKAVIVESPLESSELKPILENLLGFELTSENSTIESTGSGLGKSFYNQLRLAIILSFILMAIVVFIIFRTAVPSLAVVISAFADIMMTLSFINLLGIKISSAGITAILMLIGYSVDSDIMLTTRLLKRHEDTNQKLKGAIKTGLTMTLTSLIAILVAFLITRTLSPVLGQIFLVLIIGLSFDILNTWITNVSILKWYLNHKEKRR